MTIVFRAITIGSALVSSATAIIATASNVTTAAAATAANYTTASYGVIEVIVLIVWVVAVFFCCLATTKVAPVMVVVAVACDVNDFLVSLCMSSCDDCTSCCNDSLFRFRNITME